MGKPGRKSREAVAERRAKIVRFMAELLKVHDKAVREIAEHVDADVRTVRADLEVLMSAREPLVAPPVSAELVRDLERIDNLDALNRLRKRLAVEHAAGRLSLADARFYTTLCRDLRTAVPSATADTETDETVLGRALTACMDQVDGEEAPPDDGGTTEIREEA